MFDFAQGRPRGVDIGIRPRHFIFQLPDDADALFAEKVAHRRQRQPLVGHAQHAARHRQIAPAARSVDKARQSVAQHRHHVRVPGQHAEAAAAVARDELHDVVEVLGTVAVVQVQREGFHGGMAPRI